VDSFLALDPRLLWNVPGKTENASIARLVSAFFPNCGCRIGDSATSREKRTVEKETILGRTRSPTPKSAKVLVNAVIGKVDTRSKMSGKATYQELTNYGYVHCLLRIAA
jgi:hypothetical protein